MKGHSWTADEDATLIRLAAQKLSARAIADVIGKSRNAILGRSKRLRATMPELEIGDPNCFWTQGQKEGLRRKRNGLPRRSRKYIWEKAREKARTAKRAEAPIKYRSAAMSTLDAANRESARRRRQMRIDAMKTQTSEHAIHPYLDENFKHNQCRWPLWPDGADFSYQLVCGCQKEDGSSYCPAHAYRASNWVKGEFVRQPGYFKSWVNTGRAA